MVAAVVSLLCAGGAACEADDQACSQTGDRTLMVTPSNLPFASVCPGESETMSLVVRNQGPANGCPVTLSGARLEGLGSEFTVSLTPVTLLPGQSAVVTVTYTPLLGMDPPNGVLVLEHDVAAQGLETRIPITAEGGQRADLLMSPNPIDFGEVEFGKFRELDVLVKNFRCTPVNLASVSLDIAGNAGFSLLTLALPEGGAMPLALAHDASLGVKLRFQPTACGIATSTLSLAGTGTDAGTFWPIDVLGVGTACPVQ
jgi:hypothetical protein